MSTTAKRSPWDEGSAKRSMREHAITYSRQVLDFWKNVQYITFPTTGMLRNATVN